MNSMPSFLRRDVASIKPWTETCGQIRPLIEEKDDAAAEVHHLEITDAKLHYHERTDEIYYVLAGSGRMRLDDEEIELRPDVTVYVPRGVKHKAWGNLTVLVVSSLAVYCTMCTSWSRRRGALVVAKIHLHHPLVTLQ